MSLLPRWLIIQRARLPTCPAIPRWRFPHFWTTSLIRVVRIRCRKNWKLPDNWACSLAFSPSLGYLTSFYSSSLLGVIIVCRIPFSRHRYGLVTSIQRSTRWSIPCVTYIFVVLFKRSAIVNMPRLNYRIWMLYVNFMPCTPWVDDDKDSIGISFFWSCYRDFRSHLHLTSVVFSSCFRSLNFHFFFFLFLHCFVMSSLDFIFIRKDSLVFL